MHLLLKSEAKRLGKRGDTAYDQNRHEEAHQLWKQSRAKYAQAAFLKERRRRAKAKKASE